MNNNQTPAQQYPIIDEHWGLNIQQLADRFFTATPAQLEQAMQDDREREALITGSYER